MDSVWLVFGIFNIQYKMAKMLTCGKPLRKKADITTEYVLSIRIASQAGQLVGFTLLISKLPLCTSLHNETIPHDCPGNRLNTIRIQPIAGYFKAS